LVRGPSVATFVLLSGQHVHSLQLQVHAPLHEQPAIVAHPQQPFRPAVSSLPSTVSPSLSASWHLRGI
jgi:hypothetical protein